MKPEHMENANIINYSSIFNDVNVMRVHAGLIDGHT